MRDATRRLRSQVRRFENRRTPRGTRYSAAFRDEVVRVARGSVADGVPLARVARELGLRPQTLKRWLDAAVVPRLREVHVEKGAPATDAGLPVPSAVHAVVVTPSGLRIEGLDVDGVVRLVRSLA